MKPSLAWILTYAINVVMAVMSLTFIIWDAPLWCYFISFFLALLSCMGMSYFMPYVFDSPRSESGISRGKRR